jgi:hypothetical protein
MADVNDTATFTRSDTKSVLEKDSASARASSEKQVESGPATAVAAAQALPDEERYVTGRKLFIIFTFVCLTPLRHEPALNLVPLTAPSS